jgi:hypothetical protein
VADLEIKRKEDAALAISFIFPEIFSLGKKCRVNLNSVFTSSRKQRCIFFHKKIAEKLVGK